MIFHDEYKKLNPAQKQAVDTIEGPVLVTAGPGTGKTQVLTLRIANILQQTDTVPQNIIALTYTDSAANTMRERLATLIGSAAYRVRIQTFHSFCQNIIDTHPEFFPFSQFSQIISDVEKNQLFRTLIDELPLKVLRPMGLKYYFIKNIASAIESLKKEGISPDTLSDLVCTERSSFEQEKSALKKGAYTKKLVVLEKQEELVRVYKRYQEELFARMRFDFDDMIMQTIQVLQNNPELLIEVQETCQYLLIDEYQDTNGAQNTIAFLLSSFWGEQANIFAVGDPDQTIFRFQGATLENAKQFVKRFPKTVQISLDVGYRCTQTTYDVIAGLMKKDETPLRSSQTKKIPIKSILCADSTAQGTILAEHIMDEHGHGVPYGQMVVLTKKNARVQEIADVLSQFSIPIHTESSLNILESHDIQNIVSLLKLLFDLPTAQESKDLYTILSLPWIGLDPLLVMQVTRACNRVSPAIPIVSSMRNGIDFFRSQDETRAMSDKQYASLTSCLDTLQTLSILAPTQPLPTYILHVLNTFSYTRWALQQPNSHVLLQNLVSLLTYAKNLSAEQGGTTLSQFLWHIQVMQDQHFRMPNICMREGTDEVTISTIHKAKGQEWTSVYIPDFIDGVWGNMRGSPEIQLPEGILTQTHTKEDGLEEDRRLLYVALSRAKQTSTVLSFRTKSSLGKSKEIIRSQFSFDLPAKDVEVLDLSSEQIPAQTLAKLTTFPDMTDTALEWLRSLAQKVILSPSNLNMYLRSPMEFFMHELLKVPSQSAPHLSYGVAVHTALEFHYSHYIKQKHTHPPTALVLDVFHKTLQSQRLPPQDHAAFSTKGDESLAAYFSQALQETPNILHVEKKFGGREKPILVDGIALSGKIDRIDQMDGTHLLVTDYKTGGGKSHNVVSGITVTSEYSARELTLPEHLRSTYKRQLLFYKLLLSLDPLFAPYQVTHGCIDFIEGGEGKSVRHQVELPDEHVKDFIELIKTVSSEIRSLSFLLTDDM